MKTYIVRLRRGDDILGEIQKFCIENGITAGVVLSGVGCVTVGKIRIADGVTIKEIKEDMEIVSLTGTVGEERCHIHISFSKNDMSTIGGHLVLGSIVNTTLELAILSLEDKIFTKEFDESTGYHELKILDK